MPESRASILIVEDQQITAMELRSALNKLGHHVCAEAVDGDEAIARAWEHRPHLLLMDINLPGRLNGIEAAQEIRKEHDVPVVYVTAYGDENTLKHAAKTEPYGYILKPYDHRELEIVVTIALQKHRLDSQLKSKQAALERKTEELLRTNRRLEEFARISSHDLRAPVVNLASLMEYYRQSTSDNERAEIFSKLQVSVKRLDHTLENLISILRQTQVNDQKKEETAFRPVLDEVLNSIEMDIKSCGAEIRADFSKAPEIYYYTPHIKSILQNLITNAIKYRSKDRKPVIDISTAKTDGFVCLSVADNGIGIDLEANKGKLFRMFQRFTDQAEGKGIGLYIVRSQIESMGGRIEAESKPGKGSIFRAFLRTE